jgi:hypothetical protein
MTELRILHNHHVNLGQKHGVLAWTRQWRTEESMMFATPVANKTLPVSLPNQSDHSISCKWNCMILFIIIIPLSTGYCSAADSNASRHHVASQFYISKFCGNRFIVELERHGQRSLLTFPVRLPHNQTPLCRPRKQRYALDSTNRQEKCK